MSVYMNTHLKHASFERVKMTEVMVEIIFDCGSMISISWFCVLVLFLAGVENVRIHWDQNESFLDAYSQL